MIHESAIVDRGAHVGLGTDIWHWTHIREGVAIGRNCHIGQGVYIDKHVRIGNNVKIQNGVYVYRGVIIRDNVFIGPNVTFTNDLYPRSEGEWTLDKTLLDHGCSIGAGSVVLCGIRIGKWAMIGAGSVVTKDIPDHALVMGNPIRIEGYVCYCGHGLEDLEGSTRLMFCKYCGKHIPVIKSGLSDRRWDRGEEMDQW